MYNVGSQNYYVALLIMLSQKKGSYLILSFGAFGYSILGSYFLASH